MRTFSSIIFLVLMSGIIFAQKEDYNYIYGLANPGTYPGLTVISFEESEPKIKVIGKTTNIGFLRTNACISDASGKNPMYSNGMHIYDESFNIAKNGEKINYNAYWDLWKFENPSSSPDQGLKLSQGMIMLPNYALGKIIWITHSYDIGSGSAKGFFYGEIDITTQEVIGYKLIHEDLSLRSGGMHACRHANGRDWWVTIPEANLNKMYVFLLDGTGLHLHSTQQFNLNKLGGGTQRFSPDGKWYLVCDEFHNDFNDFSKLALFRFDRETATFAFVAKDSIYSAGGNAGMAFSPDSRLFYITLPEKIVQYDLESTDVFATGSIVAKLDDVIVFNKRPFFGTAFNAPDGRIYINTWDSPILHKIEYPDERGSSCKVVQRAFLNSKDASSTPNWPNYRLGPLDGSVGDTLGLDNHPISKFRFFADSINHLKVRFTDLSYFRPEKWTWDFGDGTTFDGKKPYWHTFPKNGTYNVCLTVSNENSSNTSCRLVTIGTSSVNGEQLTVNGNEVVSTFPNPVQTEMLITISEYIPEKGEVFIYDMMGREVLKQRVYYGWNNVDMSGQAAGTYIYKVMDGRKKIGEGKVVKM